MRPKFRLLLLLLVLLSYLMHCTLSTGATSCSKLLQSWSCLSSKNNYRKNNSELLLQSNSKMLWKKNNKKSLVVISLTALTDVIPQLFNIFLKDRVEWALHKVRGRLCLSLKNGDRICKQSAQRKKTEQVLILYII